MADSSPRKHKSLSVAVGGNASPKVRDFVESVGRHDSGDGDDNPFVVQQPQSSVQRTRKPVDSPSDHGTVSAVAAPTSSTASPDNSKLASRNDSMGTLSDVPQGTKSPPPPAPSSVRESTTTPDKAVARKIIAEKRDVFFKQYNISIQREELRKRELMRDRRRAALEASELELKRETEKFEEFMKHNQQLMMESTRVSEEATRQKLDKFQTVKKLQSECVTIKSELHKLMV